jgi:DNA modification methylase
MIAVPRVPSGLPINQIICGDCLEVMKDWPDRCVDLVLTDIPYGEVNRTSNGLRVLDKADADVETFALEDFTPEIARISSGSVYVFCGTEQVSYIRAGFVTAGMSTRLGFWEKTNPSPMNGQYIWLSGVECCVFGKWPGAVFNEHCANPVWRAATERQKLHRTQKPLALMTRLLAASTIPEAIVLDPTCGSGTTCVAAKQLGRRYIGIDISPEYCEIARNRLKETVNEMV